jgi:hypothetical protein
MNTIEIPQDHVFTAVSVNGKIVEHLKPIKINDYWVVVHISNNNDKGFYLMIDNIRDDQWAKIIASTKFIDKSIPIIKFVKCTAEELAEIEFPDKTTPGWKDCFSALERNGFVVGYNANKSSDKKYTEQQVRKVILKAFLLGIDKDDYSLELEDRIIQSLNNIEFPDVINLEMEKGEWKSKSTTYDQPNREWFEKYDTPKLKTKSTPEGEIIEILI